MRDAGIPEPLLGYRLDGVGGYVVGQDDDEDWLDFRERVLELAKYQPRIGIVDCNREAIRDLARWSPPRWLVLTGSVGTGKTLLIAALVRRLLTQQPDSTEDLPDESVPARTEDAWSYALSRGLASTLRRQPVPRIEYHRVDDLVRREALKLRGLDPAPTADAAKRPHVLILDELGLSERPTEAEARLVERILCYRADHGLTTVCASNRTWEELTMGERPLYGRRVADRLRAATSVELAGPSWRGAP
jgi:DNA replication protein DnaC